MVILMMTYMYYRVKFLETFSALQDFVNTVTRYNFRRSAETQLSFKGGQDIRVSMISEVKSFRHASIQSGQFMEFYDQLFDVQRNT